MIRVAECINMEYMLRDDKRQHVEKDEKGAKGDTAWTGEEVVPQTLKAGSKADKDGRKHKRGADETADIKSLFVQIHVLIFEKQHR